MSFEDYVYLYFVRICIMRSRWQCIHHIHIHLQRRSFRTHNDFQPHPRCLYCYVSLNVDNVVVSAAQTNPPQNVCHLTMTTSVGTRLTLEWAATVYQRRAVDSANTQPINLTHTHRTAPHHTNTLRYCLTYVFSTNTRLDWFSKNFQANSLEIAEDGCNDLPSAKRWM